eukprot:TRINITY_DN12648_c0_g1_i1.p1 TRINITY_DN12648_c0_g1~~TRINITY_DN12648_c0_g1_i1.p1  ORF type:complete len:556 (+),score=114.22 TRINITY_DN12648_c0_g1_i1:201-1868(+)
MWRGRGNECFRAKRHDEAIAHYTKAVIAAQSSKAVVLALNNRVACLQALNKHASALRDCEFACELMPRDVKSQYRRASVTIAMSGFNSETESMLDLLQELACPPADVAALRQLRRKAVDRDTAVPTSEPIHQPWAHAMLASNDREGRFMVAAEDIMAGCLLLCETPAAAVLLQHRRTTHCGWCFALLGCNTITCLNCISARYCCNACRVADIAAHSPECSYGLLDVVSDAAHLAIRCVQTNQTMADLELHLKDRNDEILAEAVLVAVYAAACGMIAVEQRVQLMELILKCTTNAFTISSFKNDGTERVQTALGLFPQAAMMNHSCVPSVTVSFVGRMLSVMSGNGLQQSQALTHCYGPRAGQMDTALRQRALLDEYLFVCQCTACQQRADFADLSCPICHTACNISRHQQCPTCKEDLPIAEWQQRLQHANELYCADTLASLQQCVELLESMWSLDVLNMQLARARDALARHLCQAKRYHDAMIQLRMALLIVERVFGDESVEYAHECLKYAEVASMAENAECITMARLGNAVLRKHYPPQHELFAQQSLSLAHT